MKKKMKVKFKEEFEEMHNTSSLLLNDPGAAATYAAQEAFSAGVTPSAVMYSSPDGAATGDHSEAPGEVLGNSTPVEDVEPVEVKEENPKAEKAVRPKQDKAVKPKLDKSAPVEDSDDEDPDDED